MDSTTSASEPTRTWRHGLLTIALLWLASPGNARAQTSADPGPPSAAPSDIEEIVIEERPDQQAQQIAATGSRLGLDDAEVPATLDRVTQERMFELGLDSVISVYNATPGMTAGNPPWLPGEAAVRGFIGGNAVSYLFDGVQLANSALMSRNWDSWNFERIEVLKGPASVLHGAGALAGAINLVPKAAQLGASSSEVLLSGGSFGASRVGLGANLPLGDQLALRGDVSWKRSGGFIDDSDSATQAVTTSALFAPTERLTVSFAIDYFEDDYDTSYWGTPLVPASAARNPARLVSSSSDLVVDESARDRNYNFEDGEMDSRAYWLRSRAHYELGDSWSLTNEISYFRADRAWLNSEDYSFDATSGLLDRTTTIITHDQRVWMERAMLAFDGDLGGARTRFALGGEYSETEFLSDRRFGSTTSVDLHRPDRGRFPAETAASFPSRSDFDSEVDAFAGFAELALALGSDLTVVSGLRYDDVRLDRRVDDLAAGTQSRFGRDFDPLSWRAGAVYSLLEGTQLFGVYSHAVAPVSSLLLINPARAAFDLTTGNSVELGLRSRFWEDRIELTASVYRIRQEDILTRDPQNPALSVQGGRQSSRGFEFQVAAQLSDALRIQANGALLDARFDELLEGGGANREGNRPRNVPERVFGVSAHYRLPFAPLTLGLFVQHVGDFHADNANSIRVDARTLLDVSLAWETAYGEFVLRGRNLTDEFYVEWANFGNQVFLGAPRSVEVVYQGKF